MARRPLLERATTAVLTMEVQRGVVGDLARLPLLADAVRDTPLLATIGELCAAARAAAVPVVHCTAQFRADRRGTARNCRLLALTKDASHLTVGTPAVEIVPEVGCGPGDLVVARHHGVSPFTGTELDATLRALGVHTVVATGVSLNIGIPGLVIEAVNLGYTVVLPRDAVAGVPADYAGAVIEHSLSLLATVTDVAEVIAAFGPPDA